MKPTIVIEVLGGVVTAVYCSVEAEVQVFDYDNETPEFKNPANLVSVY